MRRGIYAGVWDLLHPGHLYALEWARQRCDYLVAAVNVDPTIDNPKKQKPVESVLERDCRLRACKFVDAVLSYHGQDGLKRLYEIGNYDVAFISIEHQQAYTSAARYSLPAAAEIIFVPKLRDYSSTRLRQRIVNLRI